MMRETASRISRHAFALVLNQAWQGSKQGEPVTQTRGDSNDVELFIDFLRKSLDMKRNWYPLQKIGQTNLSGLLA
ncbi:MAG: hypothetical protein WCH85_10900, partial [Methanomicrobiales archaeon]